MAPAKGSKFPNRYDPPIVRFNNNYVPEPNTGCWLWLGYLAGSKGYGYLDVNGKSIRAHRFSYEQNKGQIPKGMVVDHLCGVSCCVNPDHLEAVTQDVNMRRGKNTGKYKLYCHKGHPRFGDNLYIFPNGQKACRECTRISVRKYQERKRKNAKTVKKITSKTHPNGNSEVARKK